MSTIKRLFGWLYTPRPQSVMRAQLLEAKLDFLKWSETQEDANAMCRMLQDRIARLELCLHETQYKAAYEQMEIQFLPPNKLSSNPNCKPEV